ncbi:hypothetical protein ACIPY6_43750 [Streptomyces sp. NPDC090054]|uniref:hypothetical protein n=1 Tax=Streptomyces sp. NPDC090054 TaxID=3365933 RepID=UPI00382352B6
MQQRVSVLADRLDSSIAEDVARLRDNAEAQRMVAVRHRASVVEMQQETHLREEMQAAAPVQHARENDERASTLREGQSPTRPPQSTRLPLPAPQRENAATAPGHPSPQA